MQKMRLLQNAIKSSRLTQIGHQDQRLSSFMPRRFSIQVEKQSQQDSTPLDPFLQDPTTGLCYGRVVGISKYTTRSDILNLLEGCKLTLDDLKVEYNRSYFPNGMMVQFPSMSSFDGAIKEINKKGRLYRLDRVDRARWDAVEPFKGKTVLLQGIPRRALQEDVERFLSGCEYDATSLTMFVRQAFPNPIKMALVRFPSPSLAMNAFITKNRGFCLNNQVLMRILH